jgi:hypothetical protein
MINGSRTRRSSGSSPNISRTPPTQPRIGLTPDTLAPLETHRLDAEGVVFFDQERKDRDESNLLTTFVCQVFLRLTIAIPLVES